MTSNIRDASHLVARIVRNWMTISLFFTLTLLTLILSASNSSANAHNSAAIAKESNERATQAEQQLQFLREVVCGFVVPLGQLGDAPSLPPPPTPQGVQIRDDLDSVKLGAGEAGVKLQCPTASTNSPSTTQGK